MHDAIRRCQLLQAALVDIHLPPPSPADMSNRCDEFRARQGHQTHHDLSRPRCNPAHLISGQYRIREGVGWSHMGGVNRDELPFVVAAHAQNVSRDEKFGPFRAVCRGPETQSPKSTMALQRRASASANTASSACRLLWMSAITASLVQFRSICSVSLRQTDWRLGINDFK